MKLLILMVGLFLCESFVGAQGFGVNKKDSCYFKYDKKGNKMTNEQRRYADWECGQLVGIVDCNNQLSYDEEHDIVIRRSDDNTNLQGVGKPYTGKCETCHMNGTIERRINFVNGKEHGTDTTKYQSGCPQVVRTHINGVENGQWTYYYDSTNIMAWEMNYYLSLKHGKHIYFERDGDTIRWENYKNDLLDGKKRTYYDNSKIKREATYKEGSLHGPFTAYKEDGTIHEELKYKNGLKDGESKYYYDDGILLKTENWNDGLKHGYFKVYFYQGDIQVQEYFKHGLKEGWYEEFYPNGITKHRILYKKDIRVEEVKYDDHGRITFQFPAPIGEDDDATPGSKKKKKTKKNKKAKKKKE